MEAKESGRLEAGADEASPVTFPSTCVRSPVASSSSLACGVVPPVGNVDTRSNGLEMGVGVGVSLASDEDVDAILGLV